MSEEKEAEGSPELSIDEVVAAAREEAGKAGPA